MTTAMTTDSLKVVDASKSSITSREDALKALKNLGGPDTDLEGLLVYVPAKAPETEEDKQKDPFALYTVCGSVFPDGAGDAYMHICLKAKPDQATEIRRIFNENPAPSFAVIDAIGAGRSWPNLQVALRVESANDILLALLAPTDKQKQALEAKKDWVPLYEKHNVDLVLESDCHCIKRTIPIRNDKPSPDGVVYLGEGGYGAPQRDPDLSRWYFQRRWIRIQGRPPHDAGNPAEGNPQFAIWFWT